MTVREFVTAIGSNPHLIDLEIGVVTQTVKEISGQFDGGTWVHFRPVKSVTTGEILLLWIDQNIDSEGKRIFLANASKWPDFAVIGPIPEDLKW